jgi:SnoaL-like polyketide cyclase.
MIDILCPKMVQDRKKYEDVLENFDLKTKEDAKKFAEALTKIIWDHQMIGLVHEFYDENVVYKTANGKTITNAEGVVLEYLAMQAAFPDLIVNITH